MRLPATLKVMHSQAFAIIFSTGLIILTAKHSQEQQEL